MKRNSMMIAKPRGFWERFCLLFSVLLLVGTIFTVFVTVVEAQEIYAGVVRLHVLADSDEEEEQKLKLLVRDAVLSAYGEELSLFSDVETAKTLLGEKLPEIKTLCEDTVKAEGSAHSVTVTLTKEYYPTRVYDGFTLPAGEYTSLRILIGSGEGQNWFCMVYPPLCTASCEKEEVLVEAGFSQSQVRFLTEGEEGYTLRFKLVETVSSVWHKVKGWFSK